MLCSLTGVIYKTDKHNFCSNKNYDLLNRSCVAGAVIQTPSSLNDSFINWVSEGKKKHVESVITIIACQTPSPFFVEKCDRLRFFLDVFLVNWAIQVCLETHFKFILGSPPVRCHVTRVTCQVWHVIFFLLLNFFFFTNCWSKLVKGLLSMGTIPGFFLTRIYLSWRKKWVCYQWGYLI